MTTRKWGGEFTVNTLTAGTQNQPAVTALADGGFMVAWTDLAPATTEIKMQRYDALGNPVGGEFLPSEKTLAQSGSNPDLVQLSDGNIWVASNREFTTDFDAEGHVVTLAGAGVRDQSLGTGEVGNQTRTAVASLGANGAVGVYYSDVAGDILMDIYDSGGSPVLDDALVNAVPFTFTGAQDTPAVAANAAGTRIAVVWEDSTNRCVVFDNTGAVVAAEFAVGTPGGGQQDPDVAWLDNDRFAVTWSDSNAPPNLDAAGAGVYYAIYNSTGTMIGSQRLANTTTAGNQGFNPKITALRDGGFAIAWVDDSQTGGDNSLGAIRLQVFNALGNPQGAEILVNTATASFQLAPDIATLADGRIVVTWTDQGTGDAMAQIVDPRDGLVDGTGNADTLYGHDAVGDVISGFDGSDALNGLAGDDVLHGGGSGDSLVGGRGNDTAYGGAAGDSLFGQGGDDALFGQAGGDSLRGGRGEDTLDGGAGDDVLGGNEGADVLNGRDGTDTADYAQATAAVRLALDLSVIATGDALGDQFFSIENLTGSGFDDFLRGSGVANRIDGGNGADRLEGVGGADVLIGGLGNDVHAYNSTGEGGDTIQGFSNAVGNDDSFAFRGAGFAHAVGGLLAGEFQSGVSNVALIGTVRFFYETDTGILRYDSDGSGGNASIVIATLTGLPAVVAGDISFF